MRGMNRIVIGAACLAASLAQAQVFSEPALEALYRAEKHVELDRIAQQRLATQADDRQAVLAAALVAQHPAGTSAQRQAAIQRAQACVELQPKAHECHYALGSTLGVQAMTEGLMKMAGSIGRVRSGLAEALALAPQWYPARSAMVSFYVLAPGLLGGSRDKALDTAQGAATPDQARALQAFVLMNDDKPDAALQAFEAIKPGADPTLDDDVRQWAHNAGFMLLNAGQPARARSWFERAVRDRPADAIALYGLGRVQADSGAHADALGWYERAARGPGADALPLDYRIGITQQALGQLAAARAAFTRFVNAGKGPKKALDDARRRLQSLG